MIMLLLGFCLDRGVAKALGGLVHGLTKWRLHLHGGLKHCHGCPLIHMLMKLSSSDDAKQIRKWTLDLDGIREKTLKEEAYDGLEDVSSLF